MSPPLEILIAQPSGPVLPATGPQAQAQVAMLTHGEAGVVGTAGVGGVALPPLSPRPRVAAPAFAPRRPEPSGDRANVVRARCLALGGLTAMAAAVGLITATTLGGGKPAVAVAAKIPAAPRYWIARHGQSLISIAARESISPSAVERANPALVGRSLAPGQRVRLPSS